MPKIIVGVDHSERSRDAVALASQLARVSDAGLVLVSAYSYEAMPSRAGNEAFRRYLRDDAAKTIQAVREGVADLPDVTERTVADPSPARALHTDAVREEASLIVIGSSHRGGLGRVLAGTTAERLLHGSPCPVAVAPVGFATQDARAVGTVAVAYNGTTEAKAALVGATAMARALHARLRVVEVLELAWTGTPALMSGPGYYADPKALEERMRASLAAVVATLPDDVTAEPVVVVGDAEHELTAQSESADLFVVGSRGYGPHLAVMLGSVSGRLARHAACPVVVVPRGVESPLEDLFRAPSGMRAV